MKDTKTRLESYQPLWSNWYLDERINSGSSGEVYKFKQKNYEMYSAVKVITMLLEKEPGFNLDMKLKSLNEKRIRAENEIRAMYQLESCPYSVHCRNHDIKDIFDDRGRVIGFDVLIQMNYYVCLEKKLFDANLVLSEKEVIQLGTQIGEGLRASHALGIIHRDIKPANIFIGDNNDYLLGDYGISKQNRSGYCSTIAGTPEYMAPEVYKASSEKKYEKTADICSLGLVMYTLLNNNYPPFTNEKSSHNEIETEINNRLNGKELVPLDNVSDRLNAILLKSCRSDPRERYQTIEEFLADLATIKESASKPSGAPVIVPAANTSPKPISDGSMYRTVIADSTEQSNSAAVKAPAIVTSTIPAAPDRYKTVYADSDFDKGISSTENKPSNVQQPTKKEKSHVGLVFGIASVVAASAIAVTSAVILSNDEDSNIIQPEISVSKSSGISMSESESRADSTPYVTVETTVNERLDTPAEHEPTSANTSSVSSTEPKPVDTLHTEQSSVAPSMDVPAESTAPVETTLATTTATTKATTTTKTTTKATTKATTMATTKVTTKATTVKTTLSVEEPEIVEPIIDDPNYAVVLGQKYEIATTTKLVFVFDSLSQEDVRQIGRLKNLEYLILNTYNVSDISPIANLANLTYLELGDPSITNISPLKKLRNLEHLELSCSLLYRSDDLSPIANLTNLKELLLFQNGFTDISAIKNLTNLTYLEIDERGVKDFSPLENLINLEYLFTYSSFAPYSALSKMKKLEKIEIVGSISEEQLAEIKRNIPSDCVVKIY